MTETQERAVWGRRAVDVHAAEDRVEAGSVRGRPAIFVYPADPLSGVGDGQIIIIEDDTGPEFVILRVFSEDGIPFSELLKVAEGIR